MNPTTEDDIKFDVQDDQEEGLCIFCGKVLDDHDHDNSCTRCE